jgi:hypothetical protein
MVTTIANMQSLVMMLLLDSFPERIVARCFFRTAETIYPAAAASASESA